MGVEPAETTAPAAKDIALIFNKVVEASEKAKVSMKLQADKHRNPAEVTQGKPMTNHHTKGSEGKGGDRTRLV